MTPKPDGTVELDHAGCLRRLALVEVGRVATTFGALPTISPVDFALLDQDIVFGTEAGTTLAAAMLDAVIAFEADHINRLSVSGWSVVVIGHARAMTDRDLARAERLLRPRARETDLVLRLSTDVTTGRSYGHLPSARVAWPPPIRT